MIRIPVALTVAAVLLSAAPGLAEAQRGRMPDPYQARPLTLPHATLRPDLALVFTSYRRPVPDDRLNQLTLLAGLGAGIVDDFELGAEVLPLHMAPDFDYLNPSFYFLYRFLRGPVEIGVGARFFLPVDHRGSAEVGLPFLVHAGRVVRLDFGFYTHSDFDDFVDLRLPFAIAFQVSNPFFFGFDTGATVHVWRGRDDVDVPLGTFFGYTVIGSGEPVVDLIFGFRLPDTEVGFDVWQTYAAARFYLFL